MFISSLLNLSGVVCLQTDRHESKRNKVKVNIQGKHLRRAICAPMFPCICVGNDLSSRLVAKQVFSAQQSLTSVFGMGTGGPSASETLTLCRLCLLVHLQGLEPWTPWLRVRCSTNWAKGAYPCEQRYYSRCFSDLQPFFAAFSRKSGSRGCRKTAPASKR